MTLSFSRANDSNTRIKEVKLIQGTEAGFKQVLLSVKNELPSTKKQYTYNFVEKSNISENDF